MSLSRRSLITRGVPVVAGAAAVPLLPGLTSTAVAADEPPLTAVHRPSPLADRVVATLDGDPATTRAVSWRTDATVAQGRAQIAEATTWTEFTSGAATVDAVTTPHDADLGFTAHFHTVTFTGLTPETTYLYRVGADGGQWSQWYEFTTASADADPFTFVFIGDAQNDIREHFSRVARRVYAEQPALVVHPGDLVDIGDRDWEWGDWTAGLGERAASVPMLAAPGNHEYFLTGGGRGLNQYWGLQFAYPDNGPEGDEDFAGTVYRVDYQGVRFISLNSCYREATSSTTAQNDFLDAQAAWLEAQLAENPNEWTVVFFHHPTYSTASGRNNQSSRDRWKPLLESYGVDLVLSGHDHTYGRGRTVAADGGEHNGPVYVNSVSGPKMYDVSGANWSDNGATLVTRGEDIQLYQVVKVASGRISFTTYTSVGEWFDGFDIIKRGGSKRVLETRARR